MFYAELVAPFFIFGPRPIRLVGFASLVLLQFLIAATGNYGFFNLLAVVHLLCIAGRPRLGVAAQAIWIPAAAIGSKVGSSADARAEPGRGRKPGRWPRQLVVGAVGGIIDRRDRRRRRWRALWPEFAVPTEFVTSEPVGRAVAEHQLTMGCSR